MNKVAFISISLTLLIFAGCKNKPKAEQSPPVVEVIEVEQKYVPIEHQWVGTLDGFVNAHIKAQVSGYLLSQDYNEGVTVKMGDRLFLIDPRTFQAALGIAQGNLAQTQAQLAKTRLDVENYTPMIKENAISRQDYYYAIEANQAAEAALVSANAAVEQAKLNLGFTQIVSPINGIAAIATAQIGDLVGPATGDLTTVSTVDPIKNYFTVTEQMYLAYYRKYWKKIVQTEQQAEPNLRIELSDGTMFPYPGKIYAVGLEVNPSTGTVRLAALFPNPGNVLRPGQFTRVHIQLPAATESLLIPQRAVNQLQGIYEVAVVEPDNRIDIRNVTVGQRVGSLWVIESGLNPGERVVAEGITKVKQAMQVTPQPFVNSVLNRASADPNSQSSRTTERDN